VTLTDASSATPAAWSQRSPGNLVAQQLRAVDAFCRARAVAEAAAEAGSRTRELRMDAARRLEVLRRQHAALVSRSHEQLRLSGDVLGLRRGPRVVVAHRNEWFVGKVTSVLDAHGIEVIAHTDNGADAVGLVVAEACDLVLVEDTLAMLPGEQVVQEVLSYSPDTLVAAQVAHSDRVGAFLAAGASSVFTRQVPPADVALRLAALFRA
jgi:hypothetical protein